MIDLAPWRSQIERALKVGWEGHTFDDIVAEVNAETMQAWMRPDSIAITQISVFPRYKQCFICFAGGTLEAMQSIVQDIEAFARREGCERMAFLGRPGWQRTFLNREGWHAVPLVHMEKKI